MIERYIVLDLWMALGLPSLDFDSYCDLNGVPETWSRLLDCCRHLVDSKICAESAGFDDWCVLNKEHSGPHYGADDVGPPNDLLSQVIFLVASKEE